MLQKNQENMASHQQFLDAIASAPDDVSLRLMYADWLEEHGNPLCHEWRRMTRVLVRLGSGEGDGTGYASLYGFESGDGVGYGAGYGDGNGYRYGDGSGIGSGYCASYGTGDGYGHGYDYGCGPGDGSGDGYRYRNSYE